MIFYDLLSVNTGIGGCEWPIFARAVRMDVTFWQFSNNPHNSAYMADAMIFLTILNSTCTGPFYGGIDFIGVFDFGTRKKQIHLFCFMPLVLICGMHPNIYGESFHFFYIMLLRLNVTRCNFRILLSILRSLLFAFSVPLLGSSMSTTFLVQWL